MGATKVAWAVLQVAACLVLGLACWRIVRAGGAEARGELQTARRQARAAGFLGGTAALAVSAGWLVGPVGLSVTAALLAAATGWTILLAGLSGKPRPTGAVAAVLWAATVVVGVLSVRGC